MTDRELISVAKTAMKNAYAPYSGFPVGAALECDDGTIYTGCNVENASLGCTICAERGAVSKAISEGNRQFKRIAVASETEDYCLPCGSCRQVLSEFAPNMEVLCVRADGRYVSYRLNQLIPFVFKIDR